MKNHLKRIASPKTWKIDRKSSKFVLRPSPGPHSFKVGLPLGVVLRDFLKLACTMREIKKMLNEKDFLIDGIRRKDHGFVIGLFDVLSIPEIKKNYRLVLDHSGRLALVEISQSEMDKKLCRIIGKTMLNSGRMQFNLHDGKNVIAADMKAKVGDSFLVALPQGQIKESLQLVPGASVFLMKGKHAGEMGVLKTIKGKEAVYESNGKLIETAKDYLFVIGENKKMSITVWGQNKS